MRGPSSIGCIQIIDAFVKNLAPMLPKMSFVFWRLSQASAGAQLWRGPVPTISTSPTPPKTRGWLGNFDASTEWSTTSQACEQGRPFVSKQDVKKERKDWTRKVAEMQTDRAAG